MLAKNLRNIHSISFPTMPQKAVGRDWTQWKLLVGGGKAGPPPGVCQNQEKNGRKRSLPFYHLSYPKNIIYDYLGEWFSSFSCSLSRFYPNRQSAEEATVPHPFFICTFSQSVPVLLLWNRDYGMDGVCLCLCFCFSNCNSSGVTILKRWRRMEIVTKLLHIFKNKLINFNMTFAIA